jgi:hypothetical protein
VLEPDAKKIFDEALVISDPGKRAAYLDAACGNNVASRQEVESLLAAHGEAGTFLAKSVQLPKSESTGERAGMMIPKDSYQYSRARLPERRT